LEGLTIQTGERVRAALQAGGDEARQLRETIQAMRERWEGHEKG
jgi:hypothetical protein